MNKLWLDVFQTAIAPGEIIVDVILMRIKELLEIKKSIMRENLPTHAEIVAETPLSEAVVREVAKALKKLGITEANSGGGTHFTSRKIVKDQKRKICLNHDVDEVQFGEAVISQSADAVANFRKKWNAAKKKNSTLRPEQLRVQINTDVFVHTRRMVSFSLGIDYNDSQIYYASGYQSILYRVFMALLTNRKKIIVTLGIISETALDTIFGIRPESRVLAYDAAGEDLVKLEEICIEQPVGIVYLSSRRVCPINHEIDEKRATRIHALRDTHKFIIIEDDRDVSYFRSSENVLMSTFRGKYESLIYLRPYSSFMPFTNELNLLCAPAKLIKKIRDKFRVSGKDISAATSLSLNELLGKGLFLKSETIVLTKMQDTMSRVRKVLLKSDTWTTESIVAGSACFLRLQPKHGRIPPDYYSRFKNEHIRIVSAATYTGDETALQGILISLTASMDGDCLEKELNKFNEVARRMVC